MKYYLCFAAMGAVLLVFFVREKLRSYCVRTLFWKTAVSVMFMGLAQRRPDLSRRRLHSGGFPGLSWEDCFSGCWAISGWI